MTAGHNQPDYRLTVNGRDINLEKRLIELRLRESRGEQADQLDITLDDSDGHMGLPPTGAKIELELGWAGEQRVDKGSYVIDEVEHGGAPDRLQIRARSANMGKGLRVRDSQSWDGKTLGQIVTEIAAANGLPAQIDPQLAARPVEHIDQTNESDLNFLTRLAKQHDAVCTVKKEHLIFLPTGSRANAGGKVLGTVHITRQLGDQHRYHVADRTSYDSVRVRYHNPRTAKEESVVASIDSEGKDAQKADDDMDSHINLDVKELKDRAGSEEEALRAASAEAQRIARGQATFSLRLALARPALMPQATVIVTGFKKGIDGQPWLVKSVEHSLGDGGFTSQVEMELPGNGEIGAQREDDKEGGYMSPDEEEDEE